MSGLAQSVEKMVGGLGDRVIELSRDKWFSPRARLSAFLSLAPPTKISSNSCAPKDRKGNALPLDRLRELPARNLPSTPSVMIL